MDPFATGPSRVLRRPDFVSAGRNDRELRRAAARGDLVALAPGVFVDSAVWAAADARARHLLRASALAPRLRDTALFSHRTAVAIHGWRSLDDWPPLVDITDPGLAKGRRGATARTHALPLAGSDIGSIGGLSVTSAGRTAVDAAASLPFREAVVTLDSALAPHSDRERRLEREGGRVRSLLTLDRFDEALERRLPVRGHNLLARSRAFADGRSGSVGESVSRVALHELGFPPPVLQQPFFDARGLIGYVDFWWPGCGVIGEFDGALKYSRGEYLRGLTPAEAVIAEKRREDRLRAHPLVQGFARWMWADVFAAGRLSTILGTAGLRVA